MKIHIVSTINGLKNEGMRNIATHLGEELEKENTVTYSSLKDVKGFILNGRKSDVTLVFARFTKPVYYMLRFVRLFVKNICLVCVQPITDEFSYLNRKHRVADFCLTLMTEDINNAFDADRVSSFSVGIRHDKFKPDMLAPKADLKRRLGFSDDKKLVLHIGHCSSGRGLEDMLTLDKGKYHCVVIASGMFDDEAVISSLKEGGVDLRFGFVENTEDYYNAADVYLFPTKSSEFVISIPLSVMEALSCGTPVVSYKGFEKMRYIKTTCDNAVTEITDITELSRAIDRACCFDRDKSYLSDVKSWSEVGSNVSQKLEEFFGVRYEK